MKNFQDERGVVTKGVNAAKRTYSKPIIHQTWPRRCPVEPSERPYIQCVIVYRVFDQAWWWCTQTYSPQPPSNCEGLNQRSAIKALDFLHKDWKQLSLSCDVSHSELSEFWDQCEFINTQSASRKKFYSKVSNESSGIPDRRCRCVTMKLKVRGLMLRCRVTRSSITYLESTQSVLRLVTSPKIITVLFPRFLWLWEMIAWPPVALLVN